MPKQKTHKGIRKRFKVTANGKVKHKKAFRGHKLGTKTSKRKLARRAPDRVVPKASRLLHAIIQGLRPVL